MKQMKKLLSLLLALMMLLGTFAAAGTALAAEKSGWIKSGKAWYYYVNDEEYLIGGIYPIDGKAYAFDDNGKLVTTNGWYSVFYGDSDEDGYKVWYYLDGKGVCRTGWQKLSGKWYYFDKEYGSMYTYASYVDDKPYMFSKNGVLVEKAGWYELNWGDDYPDYFYLKKSGEMVLGWKKISGKWYYFNAELTGAMAKDGTTVIDGKPYFFKKNGVYYKKKSGWYTHTNVYGEKIKVYFNKSKLVTGWKTIKGKKYYFMYDGTMATGITYVEKNNRVYYFAKNGALKKFKGWKTIDGEKYYFSKKGYAVTGWQKISGKKYFFGNYSGELYADGIFYVYDEKNDNGGYYCFNKKGIVRKGWLTVNGNTYYASKSGKLLTDWQTIDGKTYYFSPWGGEMIKGAYDIDGIWYYFDETTGEYESDYAFG